MNKDVATPSKKQIARWRKYLANERAEAAVYRELAHRRTGEEKEILLDLADAEARHEEYWRKRLGDYVGMPQAPDLSTRIMGFMARHFGSVFVLALMQSAETRSPYVTDDDAPDRIAADEKMHAEVVRALATKGRRRLSGGFRATIFGANDGLVSNVALVLGVLGSGMSSAMVLLTGISGLLAGAFSMAAGEYISVKSQTELLDSTAPAPEAETLVEKLDVDANELALVFRARGMEPEEASRKAAEVFAGKKTLGDDAGQSGSPAAERDSAEQNNDDDDGSANPWTAAISSFLAFSIGAFIPIIPFLFGMSTTPGAVVALVLVSIALLFTGGVTGLLSGKSPTPRALRQLTIGLGAAAITYGLGLLFGNFIA